MTVVVWVFALLTALVHLVVFALEAIWITRPAVYGKVFALPADDVPAIRLWAFGVGFYNLFIGLGLVGGVVAWMAGYPTEGRTLVLYLLGFTFLSGLVLLLADRLALGREKGAGIGGAIGQSGPPLIALVAAAIAMG
jgi:putative membrane protein